MIQIAETKARRERLSVEGTGDITTRECVDMVTKGYAKKFDVISIVSVLSNIPIELQASTLAIRQRGWRQEVG